MRSLLRYVIATLSTPLALSVPTADAQSGPVFLNQRTSYVLNLTANGTDVVDKSSGTHTLVPFGAQMLFADAVKYSKDSLFIAHNVRSHAEAFQGWDAIADLPVDLLSTGEDSLWAGYKWGDPFAPLASPVRFPDRPDKAIVGYVNAVEFTAIGGWDPSFNPAWDKDGDAIIDPGVSNLPAYVNTKVFNAGWEAYEAAYWTDAWKQEIQKKIDLAAAEHFDGVYFDMVPGYIYWVNAYPSMNLQTLKQQYADLFRWASNYAKTTYGTAFLITANLDPNAKGYFPDLGKYVDAGYYQGAFFNWSGSGAVTGYGLSVTGDHFSNPAIDFIKAQGMSVLDTDQIGTGAVSPGLGSINYDDQITVANLLKLFKWAIQSGSTPYSTTKFWSPAYSGIFPRFVRMLPGLPSITNSKYSTWVIGSDGDDVILVGDGNNVIYGGPGNDTIVGGAGVNTAYYLGPQSNFTITQSNGNVIVTDTTGAEGTDTLTNIQWLQFADQLISVDITPQTSQAAEYYYAAWNFYFETSFPAEIAALDGGAFGGVWQRTGQTFNVWTQGSANAAAVPTCRFFSTAFAPKSSHFYTPFASECTLVKTEAAWQYEAIAFYIALADANGVCPAGTIPLYRAYDNGMGGAPNHRYTTSLTILNQMIAAGWAFEGNGNNMVFACVPQ